MTPDQEEVARRVEKLLRLAAKNPNQLEAAAAAAKAQELLARYNLTAAEVERAGGDSGKRVDAQQRGGLYKYQRELWRAVAELNFCLYFSLYVYDKSKIGRSKDRFTGKTVRRAGGWRFEHRLVGRQVNVAGTRVTAEYLEQTVERLARERFPDPKQFFVREAVAFREGVADGVIDQIYERRRHLLKKEDRKKRDAAKKAAAQNRDGVSTSTAMTIGPLSQSEKDANNDFLHGEGWSAEQRRQKEEHAREREEEDRLYTEWAEAHPEEARKEAEAARKRARRTPWNYGMGGEDDRDRRQRSTHYYQGKDEGAKVSIEQQAGTRKTAGALR